MRLLVRLLLIWCGFYLLADTPSGWAQVWPNRPASFVTALDCPFNSKPTPSRDAAGCGIENFYNAGAIVQDGTAPRSPSNVYKSWISAGQSGGGTQLNYVTSQTYREMYVGILWRTNPQFQGRQVGNKMFFVRGPVNNGVFLFGNSALSNSSAPMIYSHNSANLDNSHTCALSLGLACFPNAGSGVLTVGTWTQLEAYIKASTTDTSRDGIVRWWVDGVLAGNYTNMNVASRGLNEWVWSETWDGTVNPPPAQEWAHFIDHLTIAVPGSGVTPNPDSPAGPPAAPVGLNAQKVTQ